MIEQIRVSIIIIKISNVNMFILCDLKGQCLNHHHVAHVYEYMGAECSKLRQPMHAIFALSRAQLLLLVVTRSRELSRECHVTKHKTPARSNFPLSNFENSGTIQFSSSSSTSRGLCPNNFEKRAHPIVQVTDRECPLAHMRTIGIVLAWLAACTDYGVIFNTSHYFFVIVISLMRASVEKGSTLF